MIVILVVIILYSVDYQSTAFTVALGFWGPHGTFSGPIGFVALTLFLKDPQFKAFRVWTIVVTVVWLVVAFYTAATTVLIDDPSAALLAIRGVATFAFWAIINV